MNEIATSIAQSAPGGAGAPGTHVEKPLQQQAEDCVELLAASGEMLDAIRASKNLQAWADRSAVFSARGLIDWAMKEPVENLSRTMQEVRNCCLKATKACNDEDGRNAVAVPLHRFYLLCACRLVALDAHEHLVPVPNMEGGDAAVRLMASIVSVVLAGGKLRLVSAAADGTPEAAGTFSARLEGYAPDDELERALYSTVVLSADATQAGLKTGPLSNQERADLHQALLDIRNVGAEMQALTLVVSGTLPQPEHRFRLAEAMQVPLLHAANEVSLQVLGGMSPEALVAQLKSLWRAVGADIRPSSAAKTQPGEPPWQDMLALLQELVALARGNAAAVELQNQLAELQRAKTSGAKPSRDLLASTQKTVEGLNKLGDQFSGVVEKVIKLLEYFL